MLGGAASSCFFGAHCFMYLRVSACMCVRFFSAYITFRGTSAVIAGHMLLCLCTVWFTFCSLSLSCA